MSENRKKSREVREPVQVYLTTPDRKLLREVAVSSGLSGAEVLRRGLRRMAGELLAERNPVVALIDEMTSGKWAADTPSDVAVNHDQYLAIEYAPSLRARKKRKKS